MPFDNVLNLNNLGLSLSTANPYVFAFACYYIIEKFLELIRHIDFKNLVRNVLENNNTQFTSIVNKMDTNHSEMRSEFSVTREHLDKTTQENKALLTQHSAETRLLLLQLVQNNPTQGRP
jgi:hypothetical protein